MSDFPIQKSAPDPLSGGQKLPREGSQEQYDRCGFKGSQIFPITGRPGTPVNNDQAASTVSPNTANGAGSRPPENVSGLNAGSGRATSVKPVDSRTIEGSTPGDHRTASKDTAASSLHQAAEGQGGPRSTRGQFPNGKNDAVNGSFGKDYHSQQFPTPDAGD